MWSALRSVEVMYRAIPDGWSTMDSESLITQHRGILLIIVLQFLPAIGVSFSILWCVSTDISDFTPRNSVIISDNRERISYSLISLNGNNLQNSTVESLISKLAVVENDKNDITKRLGPPFVSETTEGVRVTCRMWWPPPSGVPRIDTADSVQNFPQTYAQQ